MKKSKVGARTTQPQISRLKCKINVAEELLLQGFSQMRAADFVVTPKLRRAQSEFIEECRQMPADPRAKNGERFRRYGRYIFHPWSNNLSVRLVTTYTQDSALNPDDGGAVRQFAVLTDAMRTNEFLIEQIRLDFAMLPIFDEVRTVPWDVGVHVVQMLARPGIPGVSSPDCLHKDGEPFTYIHLLERCNVVGGENVVADNFRRMLLESILTDPMDSLVIRDEAVYHQVKRIEVAAGAHEGFRTVLLIDFTPMQPQTLTYQKALTSLTPKLVGDLHGPRKIKGDLLRQGYAFMPGKELNVSPRLEQSLQEFLNEWRDVPLELPENCKDQNRGRRVHEFDLLPQSRRLIPRSPTKEGFFEYQIPSDLNPEHNGTTRKFHSLTENQYQNEFFSELVFWFFGQLPLTDEEKKYPFEVGVHLIDYRPRVGRSSVPTPNRPHRDGEPWIMIALVHRQAVSGGESTIHDDDDTELFRVTLADPLDLIILDDQKVKHHVHETSAMSVEAQGSRIALAIDITPLGKVGSRKS